MNYTYMKASDDISQVSNFPKWQHRFAYSTQLNFARKFGDRLSLAVMPTLVHRNYVDSDDLNTIFAVGGSIRCNNTSSTTYRVELSPGLRSKDLSAQNYKKLRSR